MREDKHGRLKGWVLGPADLSLVEHAPAHHIGARARKQLPDKRALRFRVITNSRSDGVVKVVETALLIRAMVDLLP